MLKFNLIEVVNGFYHYEVFPEGCLLYTSDAADEL